MNVYGDYVHQWSRQLALAIPVVRLTCWKRKRELGANPNETPIYQRRRLWPKTRCAISTRFNTAQIVDKLVHADSECFRKVIQARARNDVPPHLVCLVILLTHPESVRNFPRLKPLTLAERF